MFQDNPWEAVAGLIRDTMKHQQNLAEERRQFDTNAQLTARQIEIDHKRDMLNRQTEATNRKEDRLDARFNSMLNLYADEDNPYMKRQYLNVMSKLGSRGSTFAQAQEPEICWV